MKEVKRLLLVIPSLSRNLAKRFTRFFSLRRLAEGIQKWFAGFRAKPGMTVVGILGVIIAIIGIVYFIGNTKGASAAWFDDSYKYRKKVTISNTGTAQTEFQVSFTLDTATSIAASKMQGDCDDIRITAENGELIPYWIEEGSAPCDNASTKIWVKIPSIPVSDTNIYIYYGNPSATAGRDGSKVFPFFDDFNTASLDTVKWTATGGYTAAAGTLTVTNGTVYTNKTILPSAQNYIYESRIQWIATTGSNSGLSIADVQATSSNNTNGDALVYYLISGAASNYNIAAWVADGSVGSYNIANGVTQYTATDSTYYINSFSIDSTTVKYYQNRTQTNSYTATWTTPPYLWLGYFLGSASGTSESKDMTSDWVLARKFATTAPSAGAAGTEESTPGPVAYWKLDEGNGTVANNSIQNANGENLGAGGSAPTWLTEDQCISGKCLSFDGSGDYTDAGDFFYSDALTICAWINIKNVSKVNIIINKRNATSTTGSATLEWTFHAIGGAGLSYQSNDAVAGTALSFTGATTLQANRWYHACVVQGGAGNLSYIYLNGQQNGSATQGAAMVDTTNRVQIGSRTNNTNSRFFQGNIDEVKIYPYARSAAEIKSDFIKTAGSKGSSAVLGAEDQSYLSNGLVGYYKMDEATGSTGPDWTVLDSSGSGYNRTGAGNAGSTAPGKFGNAGTFDGTADYVNMAGGAAETISFANLGSSTAPDIQSSNDATSYATPSWTPPTEGLIIAYIFGARSGGGTDVPTVTGNNLTWTVIKSLSWSSGNRSLHLVGANASGSTAGVTTIDWGSNTQLGTVTTFFQATGVDLSGGVGAAFIQSGTASGTDIGGSITLNAAASSDNRPIAGFVHSVDENKSERVNWTELDDLGGIGPTRNLETQYRSDAFENIASGSWPTSSNWGGIAAELKVGTAAPSEIDNVDSFTLSSWVNPSSSIATKALLVRNNEIRLVTDASGNPVCQIHNGTAWQTAATSGTALALGSWQHVGCTYDQKTLRVFVNGVQTGSQALTEPVANSTNVWKFGTDAGGTYGDYNGRMDEVRIYNRAFSPREVSQLYEWAPGPVGHWKMDDGSGTSAIDSSGNENTGILGEGSSAPVWTNGKYGNGLSFDGSDDYVGLGDAASINPTSQITLSVWAKMDDAGTDLPQNQYFISKSTSNSTAATNQYNLLMVNSGGAGADTDYLYMQISDGTNIQGTGNYPGVSMDELSPSQWYHVVGVYDGSYLYLYLNGALKGKETTTLTGNINDIATEARVGGRGDNTRQFDGMMDEIKIYNYARNQKQIVSDMNAGHPSVGSPVGSALAHWKMDEGYGTSLNNSGNSESTLNGTFGTGNSAPTWTNDGKFGKALSFDGSGDYIAVGIGNTATLTVTDFTISAWINGTDFASGKRIVSTYHGSSPKNFYNLGIATGNYPQFSFRDIGGTLVGPVGTKILQTDQWYPIVGVRNAGTTAKIYVNGLEVGSTADNTTGGSIGPDSHLSIGWDPARSSGFSFNGKIDEVKIYPFALTDDEVKVEYNRGKAIVLGSSSTGVGGTTPSNSSSREYCVPGDATTCNIPLAEWKMDEGVGSTANDTSGNLNVGNFGTGASTPTWAPGIKSSAVSFDGTGDLINTTNELSFSSGTSFTLSGWANPASLGTNRYVLDRTTATNELIDFYYDVSQNALSFRIRGDDGVGITSTTAPGAPTLNKWFYFTGVRDVSDDTIKLYIDGRFISQQTDATTGTNSPIIRIGNHSGAANGWLGMIDQIRTYDYARTPAQIAWEYNKGAPVAYYKMDECEGTTAFNSVRTFNDSPAGNNGTITIGATGTNDTAGTCTGDSSEAWFNGVSGKRNASLDFDGTDDSIAVSDTSNSPLDLTTSLTFSAWIKPAVINVYDEILSKIPAGYGSGYELANSSGTLRTTLRTAGGNCDYSAGTLTADTWQQVVSTYDGTNTRHYVNGILRGTSTNCTFGSEANDESFMIGKRASDNSWFTGGIDDVKVFNYPLTAAQIKTEYNGGAVRFE